MSHIHIRHIWPFPENLGDLLSQFDQIIVPVSDRNVMRGSLRGLDRIQVLLRYVFQTHNELTIPISGTGTAAMETALVNMIELARQYEMQVNVIKASEENADAAAQLMRLG